jgi:hypothetical protein
VHTHMEHTLACLGHSLPCIISQNLHISAHLRGSRGLSGGAGGGGSEGPSRVGEHGMSGVRVGGGAHTHVTHMEHTLACLGHSLP